MIRLLPLLLLLACAPLPRGSWRVEGAAWDVQRWADAAVAVSGDARGHLRAGGLVRVIHDPAAMVGRCIVPEGSIPTGCSDPGLIDVLSWPVGGLGPGPETTALAHELCHLGLVRLNLWCSPVYPTEEEADACSLLVVGVIQ